MTDDDRLLAALRDTLHDPARALPVPEDPVRWVRGEQGGNGPTGAWRC